MDRGSPLLPPGTRFADRYTIESELGRGTQSRVYRAQQVSTGQSVAIKLLTPPEGSASTTNRESDRFRREMRICAALSHTNIVRLIDSGETREGQLYTVFEHVPGETLAQVLAREGQLSLREALRLMTQVLDALACAHAEGIVHRDLKPANLMLSGGGARRNALVLDFGLGGVVEGRQRAAWQSLTQSGTFLGTPRYSSPEQLVGQSATPRSDLYAWGLILLECLTGQHPFADGDVLLGEEVEIPRWLRDHPLGALLERVTARDARKRDVTADGLIETLEEIARGELPEAPEEPGRRRPPPLTERGERRHLTVMFCDLVDSTGLAQRLGAEVYRQIVQSVQARAAEAVEHYGGHVVQYLGDGLLVYFGYPQAHEDDAARAVRAGREVLRQIALLSPRFEAERGVALATRIGINSGPVVVSEIGAGEKKEMLALGETPTIAARLEAVADPGTLLISESTLQLVSGIFVTEDLGTPALKGISDPIRVHRVLRRSGVESRLDRAPRLSPFVGREQELGLLLERFEEVREKRGQVVWISGEAGIGKSRLVYQLRERLRELPHTWLECRCSPHTQGTALHPVIELLEHALDLQSEDDAETKLSKLERGVDRARLEPSETVPLLASLVSLRAPSRYPPLQISPQLQRQKTLAALLAWLLAIGEKQPAVLVVEGLHWVDPSTQEWLGLVVEECPTAGLLVLLTFRPEFELPWAPREHVLPIALRRLNRGNAIDLIQGAVPGAGLSNEVVTHIAEQADGIPLFVEELAKGVAETSSALSIPETLQDLLMARLDRLGGAKAVAQLGAALGREFPYALLEAVAPMKLEALDAGLGRLVEAELMYRRGLPPDATYTFKHALIQDTAYASLLDAQRKELHGRIAAALETRFAARVARAPEEIARHCEGAGRSARAIAYYQRAGENATKRFAHAEVVSHLRKALDLLGGLPASIERDRQELQLHVALGPSLAATHGHGDPAVEQVYARALDLSQTAGDSPELLRALIGLSLFQFGHGRLRAAAELAERALTIAERWGDPFLLLGTHTRLGVNLLLQGKLIRARGHLEQAIAFHDPAAHHARVSVWGGDWGISARVFLAHTLWSLGYPDQARRASLETVDLARTGDPVSLAIALLSDARLAGSAGQNERSQRAAEEGLAIAVEHGYPYHAFLARVLRALSQGIGEGLEEMEKVSANWIAEPQELCRLARANRELGRIEQARTALESAFARRTEENLFDSELQREKGEILLQQGMADEAQRCFRRAIEVARRHEAKSFELAAATSLARFMRNRGQCVEARELLESVYGWFTEGFDTADLVDAKALLAEL